MPNTHIKAVCEINKSNLVYTWDWSELLYVLNCVDRDQLLQELQLICFVVFMKQKPHSNTSDMSIAESESEDQKVNNPPSDHEEQKHNSSPEQHKRDPSSQKPISTYFKYMNVTLKPSNKNDKSLFGKCGPIGYFGKFSSKENISTLKGAIKQEGGTLKNTIQCAKTMKYVIVASNTFDNNKPPVGTIKKVLKGKYTLVKFGFFKECIKQKSIISHSDATAHLFVCNNELQTKLDEFESKSNKNKNKRKHSKKESCAKPPRKKRKEAVTQIRTKKKKKPKAKKCRKINDFFVTAEK
eukprot:86243_1